MFHRNCFKILGVHFSHNREIQNEKNFCKVILDIQNILKLWRMQSGLALSKVLYFPLFTVVVNQKIIELIKIQNNVIWKNTPAKIKHKTPTLNHKQGGFKCADVTFKIINLHC